LHDRLVSLKSEFKKIKDNRKKNVAAAKA
jgi:hypothetical protein